MKECSADRVFLVDHQGESAVTYRRLLSDLKSAYQCQESASPSPLNLTVEDGFYGFLVRLISGILKNRDCDLCNRPRDGHQFFSGCDTNSARSKPGVFDGEDLAKKILNSTSRIILSTSGTTGSPKPIVQSIANLTRAVQISSKHEHDVWGLAYPPTKIAGLQVLLQALCNANTIINLFGLHASNARVRIREFHVSHLSATPTYFRLLATCDEPFPLVKAITIGGEVMDTQLRVKLSKLFPNARFRNVYAASEIGTLLHSTSDSFQVPDSVRDLIRISDGRLWIHSQLVADNLVSQCVDGFWDSGDSVEVLSDEPLAIRITGRRSDWINVGGMKVNPHEVEAALCTIPGVLDARVYGVANSVTGQFVAAELSVEAFFSLSVAEIRQLLQEPLPLYAIPRIINVLDDLVISPSGKKERNG